MNSPDGSLPGSPSFNSKNSNRHSLFNLQKAISPLKKKASLKEITESSLSSNQNEEDSTDNHAKNGN